MVQGEEGFLNILGELDHVTAKSRCAGEKKDMFKINVDFSLRYFEKEKVVVCPGAFFFPGGKTRFKKLFKKLYLLKC